ncbi:uncharacterized protein PRCAT00003152001 [Priceomyces carsonii]|uniref:uncharacterized protein n=1 Tax=Priceomyces carsonii TaxID=28549 RepID=UPI002EDAF68D|nr:unnamed protein product [Priceomyces carsonii]
MSFSPEIFNKKLESLQETQDSIVTISQWVLFHHRHSKDSARQWSEYILQPTLKSAKRLSLLYLCNDVVQQARHKRKTEFIAEFAKILPNVLNQVYSTLDPSIRPKVDRLISVWELRSVFNASDIREMRKGVKLSSNNISLSSASAAESKAPVEDISPELKHLNNLFNHLTKLVDTSQANLSQVGSQSKTYLPLDPSASDSLPSPKVYISKLNVLEKLCKISSKNIEEIKKDRLEIISQLDNLKNLVSEGLSADENKETVISSKLDKLNETRDELKAMLREEPGSRDESRNAEKMSVKNADKDDDDDDDDDAIPTYENDSEENDEEPPSKKLKKSTSSSENSTPNTIKKTVAFSEDVEVKEYTTDGQTEGIRIVRDEQNDFSDDGSDNDENVEEISPGFVAHHKDDVILKEESENDDYDPAAEFDQDRNTDNDYNNDRNLSVNDSVLNLLSKLA